MTIGEPFNVPELFTPVEVARKLRVDPKTVRRWIREGDLGSVAITGRGRMVRADQLVAFLDSRTFNGR